MNIILILSAAKKVNELTFCSGLKRYILMVSKLAFVFRFIGPIIFSPIQESIFSIFNEIFIDQGTFSQKIKIIIIAQDIC